MAALVAFTGSPGAAAPILIDFEGLGVLQSAAAFGSASDGVFEAVGAYYDGGTGGAGSGPGPDFGVVFSDNALAIVDADANGLSQDAGNFGGEPSPDTVLFFLTGDAATVNVAGGFSDGLSFFYSAINYAGVVDVYDGLNATGARLASLDLPVTPTSGAPDPTGVFSPFLPIGISFDGVARSVDFGGTINQISFDNITLGAEAPLTAPAPVPIGGAAPLLLTALTGFALIASRRRRGGGAVDRTPDGATPLHRA